MRITKVKIVSVADGDSQKLYSAIGNAGEEFTDRIYYQHSGLSSIPKAGDMGVVLSDGNNHTMISTSDNLTDRPELSNEGDVCIYSDADKFIKVLANGNILISNNNNSVTLKTNGDIELGETALQSLMTKAAMDAFNLHVHTCASPGSPTTVPTAPMIELTHCTTKVKGQ
jgi:phage gp45-like